MPTLDEVAEYLQSEHGLAVVSTAQASGDVLSSVINCGVMSHPVTGDRCIAFVSRGPAARLGHIRRGAKVTLAVRRGWAWRSVTGAADIIGLDDPTEGFDDEAIRVLLREVYQAAGGEHDDYDEYDREMVKDRRAAVFVRPEHIRGNG